MSKTDDRYILTCKGPTQLCGVDRYDINSYFHLQSFSAPSKPLDNEANSTGPHSVRLKWKKPKDLNGVVVLFKIRMLWRFKNVKGEYKRTELTVPAKVTRRARKRRSANGRPDYTVLQLEPEREIELRNLQPFAIISIRVAEGTRDAQNRVLWGPFSNNQTVETEEGGEIWF